MSLPEKGPLLIIGSCCRGPFLARPSNVLGPKEIFKIKTCWIVAQCLAHKPSLIDRFIALFSNYWNFDLESKHNKQKTAFRARTVTGTFEKRAPCLRKGLVLRLFMSMVAWSLQFHGYKTASHPSSLVPYLWSFRFSKPLLDKRKREIRSFFTRQSTEGSGNENEPWRQSGCVLFCACAKALKWKPSLIATTLSINYAFTLKIISFSHTSVLVLYLNAFSV